MERHNDEADRLCLCFDVSVTGTGYATRTPPSAGRKDYYCPRSLWGGHAYGERYVRENSRPPCCQQVRSRSDLLDSEPLDSRHAQARLLRGRVGARLHSAGNADRSLGLVMVVRTGGVALARLRSCTPPKMQTRCRARSKAREKRRLAYA